MDNEDKTYMLSGVTKPILENSEILEKAAKRSEKKSSAWVVGEIDLISEINRRKKVEESLKVKKKSYVEQIFKIENKNNTKSKEKTLIWFSELTALRTKILNKNENKANNIEKNRGDFSYVDIKNESQNLLKNKGFAKNLYLSAKTEKEKHVRLLNLANEFTKNIQYSGVERKIVANNLLVKQ